MNQCPGWLPPSPPVAASFNELSRDGGLTLWLRSKNTHRPAVQIDSLFARRLVGYCIVCTSHVQLETAPLLFTAPLACSAHQEHTRRGRLQVLRSQVLRNQQASMCCDHLIRIGIAQVEGNLVRGAPSQPAVLNGCW